MFGFSIQSNTATVIRGVRDKDKKIERAIDKALDETILRGESVAKKKVRVKYGLLRASITHRTPTQRARDLYTNKKYGPFIEFGTPPHKITAKNKKALAWKGMGSSYGTVNIPGRSGEWTGLNHPVKSVNHPGTKEYPFMRPAADYMHRVAGIVFKKHVSGALR